MTMPFALSRRGKIRAVSYLAAAFLAVMGFACTQYAAARQYETYAALSSAHAFAELSAAVDGIDATLQKSLCATSPSMISSLSTELFGKAMLAQMAIGQLPYANVELEQTAAFLAKVGDYAHALSPAAVAAGGYSQEQRAALAALSEAAGTLSQQLIALEGDISGGTVQLEDVSAAARRLSGEETGLVAGGSSFQQVESDFPEVPTLIYDGPFSDHIAQQSPVMLASAPEVTQAQALDAAVAFTGLNAQVFQSAVQTEGRIPSYLFTGVVDGGELTVEVTRQGGYVIQVFSSRAVPTAQLNMDQALEKAAALLAAQGLSDMRESYFINDDNVLTVNYAAVEDGVICYPDLVKVSVALDNGRIVGYEAEGYLSNHRARALSAPAVGQNEVSSNIPSGFSLLSVQRVIIPSAGKNEVDCYELKCEDAAGRHYIIYRNTATGNDEKILILLEDESGTLVI